jgi:hypothetical protein
MNRYKKGEILESHSLEKVFSSYESTKEVEFVSNFFTIEEINYILDSCGLAIIVEKN